MKAQQIFSLDDTRAILARVVSSLVFHVSVEDISSKTREARKIAFARQTAMYLTHVCFGMSLSRTGNVFQRDRSTVSHACHLIEDRRDNSDFDDYVNIMEHCLRTTIRSLEIKNRRSVIKGMKLPCEDMKSNQAS